MRVGDRIYLVHSRCPKLNVRSSPFSKSQHPLPNHTTAEIQTHHLSLTTPLRDLPIRLVDDICRATRNCPPFDDMPSILIDFNTALDVAHSAKRRQFLLLHIAEIAIGTDEVRAPGSLRRAELLGRLAGEVGHDQIVDHPGRTRAFVNGAGVAFAGVGCEEKRKHRC